MITSFETVGKKEKLNNFWMVLYRQVFRRMYMWEQHGMSAAAALTGIMMGSGMPKQDYAPTLKQKVFARFFEHIGMGTHADIINVIVTKVKGVITLPPY